MKELDKDLLPEDLRNSHEIICRELQVFAEHGIESSFLSFGYRLTTGKVEAKELALAKEEGAREERERIIKKYGFLDDGCGCCAEKTLIDYLEEELTNPSVKDDKSN